MIRLLSFVFFVAGLAVPCWVGAGYVGSNPLALSMTVLIGVVYLAGALELYRYQQATAALAGELSGLSGPVENLDSWVARLPQGLRNAVRQRIHGERVGLPAPALAPYLVGLLVLLGMLGTFLGMVATLRGTGLALESATDLQAIRASLAAPVQGLGLAFGTSVAGVATSAMLGLLAALCRRERMKAAQLLDARIATHLHGHTQARQREQSLKLLQDQAEVMPLVADRLQAMAAAFEQRGETLAQAVEKRGETLALALEQRTEALAMTLERRIEALASVLDQRSQTSSAALDERSQALAATLEQNSQNLATALDQRNQTLAQALQQSTQTLTDTLVQRSQALSEQLASGQQAFHAKAESAYAQLAASVEQSLKDGLAEGARAAGAAIEPIAQSTMQALAGETATMREAVTQALSRQMEALSKQSQDGAAAVAGTWSKALDEHRRDYAAQVQEISTLLDGFVQTLETRSAAVVDGVAARMDGAASAMAQAWEDAMARQEQSGRQLAADNQTALTQAAKALEQHAASLVSQVHQSQGELREQLAAQDEQRLSAWATALTEAAAALRQEWRQAGEEAAGSQRRICLALEEAAMAVSTETRDQARATMAQIQELAQAVAQAPKAAAEAVAEVRQKLSDSMARDNAMLEERSRLLETLGTLLDAVNHASTEQRKAVDELVGTSADVLQRVGTQFTDKVQAETERLTGVAEQVTGGAAQVASLGEAFGNAVQAFGASNQALMAQLQRIEQALDKSLARSDEQLAYYVAQAREVVDLSMLSQKQIIEELRQLGGPQAQAGAQTA